MAKSYNPKKRCINFHMDEYLFKLLECMAADNDRSMAAQLRRILRQAGEKWEQEQAEALWAENDANL